jgi:hypothetical protein
MYLLLQRQAIVLPTDLVLAGQGISLKPVIVLNQPIDDGFVQRFRVPMEPVTLPPYAIEKVTLPMRATQGIPPLYSLPAMLEVLFAASAYRFRFRIEYLR